MDTEVDARLNKIGTPEATALRRRAAIANARLAYHHYEKMLGSPRWAALQAAGARPQRPLWASTSVKNPAYPDTRYVTDLVAPREAAQVFAGLHREHGVDLRFGVQVDVASAYHPMLGKHIRVEHWYNALHQPQTAARAMLGQDAVYDRMPYFYTDQYDLGMEYAGYVEPGGYDQVVFRGDLPQREFIAFWLSGGRVLAGMNVNIWDVNDTIQAIVRGGATVDAARLADVDVPLEEFPD